MGGTGERGGVESLDYLLEAIGDGTLDDFFSRLSDEWDLME
jgi:hypothetical protein